jgi:hypothetical protein
VEDLHQSIPLRVASANVHSKVFDDEVVVLEMQSGTYFSLRATGVDVWKLVEANATPAQISEALGERYDAPTTEIANAVGAVLGELAEARLIVGDESLAPGETSLPAAEKAPFTAPEIERFTDMQELLLLDPIHEVDDAGWPHTPVAP